MFANPFLSIFYLVSSIGAPGWLGENRKSANDFNGVLAVSLIQIASLSDVFVLLTRILPISYPKSYIEPVLVFVALVFFNHAWIVRGRHGNTYNQKLRQSSSAARRMQLGLALLLATSAVLGFFLLDATGTSKV